MPREFNVPSFYRSPLVRAVKQTRRTQDPRKRDLEPSVLDFGPLRFKLARHFGFCFGVENAIEIAYRVISENPDKRIFLLSEMIHNPWVNADLEQRGVRFLMQTDGTRLIDFSELKPDDVVVVPAFGTTLELQSELAARGIDPYRYDATCPFVEKVWKRAATLGTNGFTVVVHGKRTHEETRATFSHSSSATPTLVILDMEEAQFVISFIKGEIPLEEFSDRFADSMSAGFDPRIHLKRIGVVNQTTMLASETKAIAEAFKQTMLEIHGKENLAQHFADTRDTLCYATYENQSATEVLTQSGADIALVVGGYNSSNTSHLLELCEQHLTTFFIKDESEIIDRNNIRHFDLKTKALTVSSPWLPPTKSEAPITFAITAGASCPDQSVDAVIEKIVGFFSGTNSREETLAKLESD